LASSQASEEICPEAEEVAENDESDHAHHSREKGPLGDWNFEKERDRLIERWQFIVVEKRNVLLGTEGQSTKESQHGLTHNF
jgi:hypothetical protein